MSLGVIILSHGDQTRAAMLAQYLAQKEIDVAVHVDKRTAGDALEPMRDAADAAPRIRLSPRFATSWGSFNLVRATQAAARVLLDSDTPPDHIALISGACLPIRPIEELQSYLAQNPDLDIIQSFRESGDGWIKDGLREERLTLYFPVNYRKHPKLFDRLVNWQRKLGVSRRLPRGLEPRFGSQWWCLSRATLDAILNDPRRREFERFFAPSWIPDESYFQTLAARFSRSLDNRTIMMTDFDSYGQPYILYDEHEKALEEAGYFFARKVSPSSTKLYRHFLDPNRPPRLPAKFEPMSAARLLARFGWKGRKRAGLISQSGYPTWPRRAAVSWLIVTGADGVADQLVFDRLGWHGRLFDTAPAEDTVLAGNLPLNRNIRDYMGPDYLSTLLWNYRPTPQGLQACPADQWHITNMALGDRRARIVAIRGGWKLRILAEMGKVSADAVQTRSRHIASREADFLAHLAPLIREGRAEIIELDELLATPDRLNASIERLIGERPAGQHLQLPDPSRIAPLATPVGGTRNL